MTRTRTIGRTYYRRNAGTGTARAHGRVFVGLEFDSDVVETVRRRATANKTSLSEEVRTLVEWGLESIKPARAVRRTRKVPNTLSSTHGTPV